MRNHYFNNDELLKLEAHDDEIVRKLVDLVRSLASERLLDYMRYLGVKYLQTENAPGLDYALWYAIINGPERLTEEEVGELHQLSEMAGGWWRLDGVPEPEFLSFEDWEAFYNGQFSYKERP
jgi:hypothetical protein